MSNQSNVAKTLRGGEFLIKDQNVESIFIPEDLNEEQQMIRQTVEDFVFKEVGSKGNELQHQKDLLLKAADLGLLGAHIPENYGGMEMDTHTVTVILEELGRAGGSFDTSYAAHTGIGMSPILYFGTEEQKKTYLPKMCSGELTASYCLTEPEAGSDALSGKTHAELNKEGTHYILNGQKMWISNAGFADLFIVFAKIDGEKFTSFVVDAHADGITLGEEEEKMGIKGSSTRQVFFENTKVPKANILGEIGKGHLIAFNVLNIGRFKLGILSCGGQKEAIRKSVKYANERVQFGQPISSFGAIQYKLAEQAIKTFTLESAVYRLSDSIKDLKTELADEGQSFEESLRKAAEEYAVECAILKVAGSEYLDYVIDEFVQIYGGNGYSEEYPAAMAYRDARINRIYEGTNEINRMLMINMILKKAMKGNLDIVGPAWEVQKELTKMPSMDGNKSKEPFEAEAKALNDFKKLVLMVAGAAAKYQMDGKHDLKEEQEVLMNVADMVIDLYMCESLWLRLKKIGSGHEKSEIFQAILKTFFHDAQFRISKNASDALASFAEGDEAKIMQMGIQRFTQYPAQNIKKLRRTVAADLIKANTYSL
jgi:alkylation response protein AidB-like acyl-CoA dehydrogenase